MSRRLPKRIVRFPAARHAEPAPNPAFQAVATHLPNPIRPCAPLCARRARSVACHLSTERHASGQSSPEKPMPIERALVIAILVLLVLYVAARAL